MERKPGPLEERRLPHAGLPLLRPRHVPRRTVLCPPAPVATKKNIDCPGCRAAVACHSGEWSTSLVVPYSFKLLLQEMSAIGIDWQLKV